MIKGLYTAASGMLVRQERMNIISNNLANAGTTAYKKDQGVLESFPEVLISKIEGGKTTKTLGYLGTAVQLSSTYTDFTQGQFRNTGNKLDLAIQGEGFFVVQTPGGLRYTRNGNFTLNSQGQIVTQQGYPVLGERGPLQTVRGAEISIDGDSQLYLGSIRGDRIRIVTFSDPNSLNKVGENLYNSELEPEAAGDNSQVLQGYLESSNVNIVLEMSKMIQVNRAYEANQKVIQAMDSTLDKAVNSVGTVG